MIVGIAGWPSSAINEEGGGAPVAHLFLLRSFLLPCFTAGSDTHGAREEALGRREREGSLGGAWLTATQEGARPSPQVRRDADGYPSAAQAHPHGRLHCLQRPWEGSLPRER